MRSVTKSRWRPREQCANDLTNRARLVEQLEDLTDSSATQTFPSPDLGSTPERAGVEHRLPAFGSFQQLHYGRNLEDERFRLLPAGARDREAAREVRTCVTSGAPSIDVRANFARSDPLRLFSASNATRPSRS